MAARIPLEYRCTVADLLDPVLMSRLERQYRDRRPKGKKGKDAYEARYEIWPEKNEELSLSSLSI